MMPAVSDYQPPAITGEGQIPRRDVVAEIKHKPEPLRPRDIVGNAEARRICGGVTRATLIAWRAKHGFPAPVRKLESGEIWDARQVREWWRRRNTP